ncbi:hypothetical protein [Exiguobacterium sp. HVEsp1]|uniref:hypothetical protein n=1 Tax=Exiguobacterium sp. HVEsp1 TaxID=1934003 RepID=UPI000990F46C|nr:hypothetical protein [Exiguobacterium sp. HVEsp1]
MNNNIETYSIQQAAAILIKEKKRMMTSQEIVEEALNKKLLRPSKAINPSNSFMQTLERNIRNNVGNNPPLKFVTVDGKRYIDIVQENDKFEREPIATTPKKHKKVNDFSNGLESILDEDVLQNIKIYMVANQLHDQHQAINDLLKFAIKAHQKDTIEKIEKLTKFL